MSNNKDEFMKKVVELKKFNKDEIKILEKMFKCTMKPINALQELVKNYDKTYGLLTSFNPTLVIESMPEEYQYEYKIGNQVFEYSECGEWDFGDDYW